MVVISIKSLAIHSLFIFVLLTVPCMVHHVNAQDREQPTASTVPNPLPSGPLFSEYKGVTIGMSADEVRQKLGNPKEKGTKQDYFVFSDQESVEVYYDKDQKVRAVSINYVGKESGAPPMLTVLGMEIEARKDGSMHRLVRYPEAGYWVSYSRTSGDAPLVTITMQKMRSAVTKAVKQ